MTTTLKSWRREELTKVTLKAVGYYIFKIKKKGTNAVFSLLNLIPTGNGLVILKLGLCILELSK